MTKILAMLALGWTPAVWAAASGSVSLQLLPAESELFRSPAGGYPCQPATGEVAIVGRFNDPEFTAASIENVSLETASGEPLPLLVDGSSVLKEFGRVISFRLCALIPARLCVGNTTPALVLKWGDAVAGTNRVVAGFQLDPTRADAYRGFVWSPSRPAPGSDGESVKEMTITLTAEHGAERHKYWHLAPLAVLLLLLAVRIAAKRR